MTYRLIGSALAVTAIVVLAIAFGAQEGDGRELVQSLILGAVLGIVLQRSRFCFLCHWRDFIEHPTLPLKAKDAATGEEIKDYKRVSPRMLRSS